MNEYLQRKECSRKLKIVHLRTVEWEGSITQAIPCPLQLWLNVCRLSSVIFLTGWFTRKKAHRAMIFYILTSTDFIHPSSNRTLVFAFCFTPQTSVFSWDCVSLSAVEVLSRWWNWLASPAMVDAGVGWLVCCFVSGLKCCVCTHLVPPD